VLTQRKCLEKNERVLVLLNNSEFGDDMLEIIKGTFKTESEKIEGAITQRLNDVDKFQEKIRNEPNPKARELLIMKCDEEHNLLDIALGNLKGAASQMKVVIGF
jgi:hypothetical protein